MSTAKLLESIDSIKSLLDTAITKLNNIKSDNADTVKPLSQWEELIKAVAQSAVVPNYIKPACLAQAIIETGRGTSKLFKDTNNAHGMKWRDEMQGYAKRVVIKVPSEPSETAFCSFDSLTAAVSGYMRFIGRTPYNGWTLTKTAKEYLKHICPTWAADLKYLDKCLSVLDEAKTLLKQHGWVDTVVTPTPPQYKILIDPGHSKNSAGASGLSPDRPSEYAMNVLQAAIISKSLKNAGYSVEIYDPAVDDLKAIGRKAAGKDLFLSLHHNAANADGIDEGTEVYIPRIHTIQCELLATEIQEAIVRALNTKDRGVKEKDYTVIATAQAAGCPRNILVESYFIDDYSSLEITTKRSTSAAIAIVEAIMRILN
jgi:N-acetylmuramoyl-L-alanine amidase